jgi:NTP pyrophosphatase (non-canonical NTP hydrolase)
VSATHVHDADTAYDGWCADPECPNSPDGPVQLPDHVAGPFSIGSDSWPGLAKLAEECGELVQVIGKLIASNGQSTHWDGKGDLMARLIEEMGDVRAAMIFLCESNGIDKADVHARADTKLERFRRWHAAGRG